MEYMQNTSSPKEQKNEAWHPAKWNVTLQVIRRTKKGQL